MTFDICVNEPPERMLVLQNNYKNVADFLDQAILITNSIAFGCSVYCIIMSTVLIASINQMINADMLREFYSKNESIFKTSTVLPFQVAMVCLMISIPIRTIQYNGIQLPSLSVQLFFYMILILSSFRKYYKIQYHANRMHDDYLEKLKNKKKE